MLGLYLGIGLGSRKGNKYFKNPNIDSYWPVNTVPCFYVIFQKESLQCLDLLFPFLALLHFSFPTTKLFLCYFQNWLSRSFSTALSLSYVLSLLTLDDSYRNICSTHIFTVQVSFNVNPSYTLPNVIFFPFAMSYQEYNSK